MTPGKVYESKFQRFDFHSIFNLVLFYNFHKEKMFTIEIEDGRKAPEKPSNFIKYICNLRHIIEILLERSTVSEYISY